MSYERILIATDGSDCSVQAIREGVRVGKAHASLITLLYVIDETTTSPDALPLELVRVANAAIQVGHVVAHEHDAMITDRVANGSPVMEIVREAESFDLIVMGSHGQGLFQRTTLGSVTLGVLEHLHRPILVVPPPPANRRDDSPS